MAHTIPSPPKWNTKQEAARARFAVEGGTNRNRAAPIAEDERGNVTQMRAS